MELRVKDLGVARGGRLVLTGVTFTLQPGRALLLRGPNGIGKTTLLRTLAGLQPQMSGTFSVPAESIAYASHADGVKSMLSVAENLTFWARVYGTGDADAAMDALNLRALAARQAAGLSAGQRRRLGLARLLVTGRPVWLLDEPTVSLDAASNTLFTAVLRAHLAAGGSALVATHVDLGLEDAEVLDLGPFGADRKGASASNGFEEAFL